MQRAVVVLLVLIVVAASCSSSTDNATEWCSRYMDAALTGVAFESTASGSPEQAAAAMDLEEAAEALATSTVPEEIESDWDVAKRGPDVADAGDSFSEAAIRVGEWAIANCGYSPEVIELFE